MQFCFQKILPTALTEQEGTNDCWDADKMVVIFAYATHKVQKKIAILSTSQQTFGLGILFCQAFSNIAMKTRMRLQKVFYLIMTYDKKAWIMNCTELLRTDMKLFHMRT